MLVAPQGPCDKVTWLVVKVVCDLQTVQYIHKQIGDGILPKPVMTIEKKKGVFKMYFEDKTIDGELLSVKLRKMIKKFNKANSFKE